MWFADYTFSGQRAPAACTEPGDGGPGQGNRGGNCGRQGKTACNGAHDRSRAHL